GLPPGADRTASAGLFGLVENLAEFAQRLADFLAIGGVFGVDVVHEQREGQFAAVHPVRPEQRAGLGLRLALGRAVAADRVRQRAVLAENRQALAIYGEVGPGRHVAQQLHRGARSDVVGRVAARGAAEGDRVDLDARLGQELALPVQSL